MIGLIYAPRFVRQLKRLPKELQEEAFQKIDLFRNVKNHAILKVHKLHGKFSKSYGFSVNYKTRVVFDYVSKTEVALLTIGDHDIYN